MKKLLLMKTMLLLCALVAGSSNLWGDNITMSHSESTTTNMTTGNNAATFGLSDTDWLVTAVATGAATPLYPGLNKDGTIRLYYNSTTSNSITVSSSNSATINSITVTYGTQTKNQTTTHYNCGVVTASGSTITDTNDDDDIGQYAINNTSFTIANGNTSNVQVWIVSIVINYTPSAGSVAAPTFSPAAGTVTAGTTVDLIQATADQIRYTLDGTDPTKTTGTVYSAPIAITTPTTIKAIAIKGENVSSVTSASYTINVTKPTILPAAGKVLKGTELTITATAGHTIRYTTDGTDPTKTTGTVYSSPIVINNPMTVKAIAVDAYENVSSITYAAYTITHPGAVDITPNYTFFGKTATYSGTAFDEVSGTKEGVTVTHTRGTGSIYANASAMRFYANNTLKIDAPTGKTITMIIFTQSNAETDNISSSPTGYTTSTHTWEGDASSVTFSRSSGSYLQFTNIEVVLAPKVTIASSGYSSLASGYALDCANLPSGLKAYKVSEISKSEITLEEVTTAVAASTGLILKGTASTSYTIPVVASGTDISASNKLKAAVTATTLDDGSFYILKGGKFCLVTGTADAAARTVPAGKAYLLASDVPAAARELSFVFGGDETTGLKIISNSQLIGNSQFYDLQGRKVANPTKGLYIVNGKKVVIK